ncbi:MAG: PEGA domain-containing protein [Myxococcota bacterium]
MRSGWGCIVLLAWALGVSPAGAQTADGSAEATSDTRLAEAQERLERGRGLFDEENYDAALAEFQAAEALLEGHPALFLVLYNIGQTYEALFRYDQAMTYYRRYLDEGGGDQDDAPTVRAKIQLLDGLLGTVRIAANVPGYEVWVDDQRVGEDATEILVPGGTHLVELRAPGYVPSQQEVQVPARSTRELSFELEELAEEYEGLSPGYFWATAGLSAAAFAVGGTFGIRALRDRRSVDDCLAANPGEQGLACDGADRRDEIRESGRNGDIIALGIGGLFAAGAVVFAVFTNWDGDDDGEEDPEAAALQLRPAGSRTAAGLVLEGRF